jgi:hypothetical protein
MSSSEPHFELNPSAENFVSEEEHGLSDSHAHQELEKAYKGEQRISKVSLTSYRILPFGTPWQIAGSSPSSLYSTCLSCC